MNTDTEKKKGFHYGWLIIFLLFMMVFISLGFCNGPKNLYLPVITSELGFMRSLYSISDSIRYLLVALGNLLFGTVVAKYGPRKMVAVGFISLILCTLTASVARTLPLFYLSGVLLGTGFAFTTTAMVSYYVDRWCIGNKGTIIGICLSASGVGGAVASQILSPMIFGDTGMWRKSYRLVALIIFIIGTLIVLLLREDPHKLGLEPLSIGGKGKKKRGPGWTGISIADARKKPFYYITIASFFITGFCLHALVTAAPAHMKDIGIASETVTNAHSIYSIFLAVSKILAGVLYDVFGLRAMLLFCSVGGISGMLLLAFITPDSTIMPYIAYSIMAFSLPLETVTVPLTAGDMFGQKDYAKLMGSSLSYTTAGFLVSGPLVNLYYDFFGTYRGVLFIAAAIFAVTVVAQQLCITSARKLRSQIEAAENN